MNSWLNILKKENPDNEQLIDMIAEIGFNCGYTKGVAEKLYKLIQENLDLRLKLGNFTKIEIEKNERDVQYWKTRNYRKEAKINQLTVKIEKLERKLKMVI